jgi:dUTP pyrophosphatase
MRDEQKKLKVRKLRENARVPSYAHEGDAGLDLYACLDGTITLKTGERALIPTGIAVELPQGFEAQIRPRSGLALMHGLTLLNSPGTIDNGYRGEIGIIVINHGTEAFEITDGMKIAQMVIAKFTTVTVVETDDLNATNRNTGGFGSTGV